MKRISVALVVMLLVAFAMTTAGEKPWFDMQNCDFCKSLNADQDMLMSLGWEHYDIDNGAMTITTVPEQYKDKYDKLQAEWKDLGARMMAGEKMTLCGRCEAFGALMQGGAKRSQIKWSNGYVDLLTSDDPAMVEKIHAFTDKTNAEMKKMEEQMKSETGGAEGHGH